MDGRVLKATKTHQLVPRVPAWPRSQGRLIKYGGAKVDGLASTTPGPFLESKGDLRQGLTVPLINHPVQSIISRTGSFPLRVACDLLRRYCGPSSVVFDPFCGKGTSLLAARILGHAALGMDIAPEAVIATRAKLVDVSLDDFEAYIRGIRLGNPSLHDIPSAVEAFFHPSTLRQILSFRNRLKRDLNAEDKHTRAMATFGLAVLLGILHGHASYSLSIPSAHAYAMSPSYVTRFASAHRLVKPLRDVRSCILKKASISLRVPLPAPVPFDVKTGSATDCGHLFRATRGKVDVILTSPPYLNAQTYAKDNWLRLWVLGYDQRELHKDYIETGSVVRYRQVLARVFRELEPMLKPGGYLICVAGDVRVRSRNKPRVFRTGRVLAELCQASSPTLEIVESEVHRVSTKTRYLHAIHMSNGHSGRDLIERVFVARKRLLLYEQG